MASSYESVASMYGHVGLLLAEGDFAGVDRYLDEASIQADTALGTPSDQLLHVYYARGEAYMHQAAEPGIDPAHCGLYLLKARQLADYLQSMADTVDIVPGERDPGVLAEVLGSSLLGRALTLEAAMTPQRAQRLELGLAARAAFVKAFGAAILGADGVETTTYSAEVASAAARLEGLLGLDPRHEQRWRAEIGPLVGQLAVGASCDRTGFAHRVVHNMNARKFIRGNAISARTSILAAP
jgi:hypothetical protein